MISTTERPFTFLYYLLNNFNDYIEKDFYTNYENQLNCNLIDKENGIIYHSITDDENNHLLCQENLDDFLNNKIVVEIEKSKILIADNYRVLISTGKNPDNYLFQTSNDLVNLYLLSINLKRFDLTIKLHIFIVDYCNNFRSIFDIPRVLNDIAKDKTTIGFAQNSILSFSWNPKNEDKIKLLYDGLINAMPPFIECDFEIFNKGFTGKELDSNEGIKWICKQSRNKNQVAIYTLVCLINLLYDKGFIKSDKNDFNKIVQNVFLNPLGKKISNIKVSKASNSLNPTRINEIQEIVNRLT